MLISFLLLLPLALAAPAANPAMLEQGTICLGAMDATVEQVMPLVHDMCWDVKGGTHEKVPGALPELNAYSQGGRMGDQTAMLVAIDGNAKWESCLGSYKTIFDDCSKDGKAAFGMRRYGKELYIIDRKIPDIPQLTGKK